MLRLERPTPVTEVRSPPAPTPPESGDRVTRIAREDRVPQAKAVGSDSSIIRPMVPAEKIDAGAVKPAPARRPELRRYAADGTLYMVLGTLVAGIGNYTYQLLGGRALGPDDFAPVGTLLTLHFLAFIVVLLPVEQLVIRSLSVGGVVDRSTRRTVVVTVTVAAGATAAAAGFGSERLFGGAPMFAVVAALSVITHGVFVVARGNLAGDRHFRSYGLASGGAAVVRLAVAAAVIAAGPTPLAVAAAVAIGPVVVLLWPSRVRWSGRPRGQSDMAAGRFLSGFILAAAASQVLLLAGPLVAGLLGASAAAVSIVFVTFTLARTPLVFGYNLIARVLPPFTNLVQIGHDHELHWWVRRLTLGGLALAVPMGLVGGALGPWVVRILFGEGFRPDAVFAALAAAGVILAGASLFIGQVLVARGDTARLAWAWLIGLAAAAVALMATSATEIVLRIGIAFLAGEVAALLGTAALALRRTAVVS